MKHRTWCSVAATRKEKHLRRCVRFSVKWCNHTRNDAFASEDIHCRTSNETLHNRKANAATDQDGKTNLETLASTQIRTKGWPPPFPSLTFVLPCSPRDVLFKHSTDKQHGAETLHLERSKCIIIIIITEQEQPVAQRTPPDENQKKARSLLFYFILV